MIPSQRQFEVLALPMGNLFVFIALNCVAYVLELSALFERLSAAFHSDVPDGSRYVHECVHQRRSSGHCGGGWDDVFLDVLA